MCRSMRKKDWRHRERNGKHKITPAKAPGDCMSIDAMGSRTPGFVAQPKGSLTKTCYKNATTFKDYYACLTDAHLYQSNDGESAVETKKAFKAHFQKHNVGIKHYHDNNGRFADNALVAHAGSKNQTSYYCSG